MAVKRPPDSPLPEGWVEDIYDNVDLERAFMRLRGLKHFWVEAWRGKIRSEQLRFDAAWKYFDRAYEAAQEVEESIPNLVRQFILNIWCFHNALAEAPLAETIRDVPEAWIPDLPEEVLKDYPEVKVVIQLRRQSEAWLRLHMGQYTDAAELFGQLIEESREDKEGSSAAHYLGLAACEHNLEFSEESQRNLENAGLMISMKGRTWEKAGCASILSAFYKFLKMEEEARSWDTFIDRLPCPQTTKDIIRKKEALVFERCMQNSTLLLV